MLVKKAGLGTKLFYVGFSIISVILLILIAYNISLHTEDSPDFSVLAQNQSSEPSPTPNPSPTANPL